MRRKLMVLPNNTAHNNKESFDKMDDAETTLHILHRRTSSDQTEETHGEEGDTLQHDNVH